MCQVCRRLRSIVEWEIERFEGDEAPIRPRSAPRATRAGTGGRVLPAWRGWTPSVTLREIQDAQAAARAGRVVPARLRPFLATGTSQIYRITRRGIDQARPLTIGMTERRKSIAQRTAQHHGDRAGGDPAVLARLRQVPADRVLVQAGRLDDPNMTIRRAHLYEIWLQDRERPLIHNQDTRTFELAA